MCFYHHRQQHHCCNRNLSILVSFAFDFIQLMFLQLATWVSNRIIVNIQFCDCDWQVFLNVTVTVYTYLWRHIFLSCDILLHLIFNEKKYRYSAFIRGDSDYYRVRDNTICNCQFPAPWNPTFNPGTPPLKCILLILS